MSCRAAGLSQMIQLSSVMYPPGIRSNQKFKIQNYHEILFPAPPRSRSYNFKLLK